jgi:hypothetical protein
MTHVVPGDPPARHAATDGPGSAKVPHIFSTVHQGSAALPSAGRPSFLKPAEPATLAPRAPAARALFGWRAAPKRRLRGRPPRRFTRAVQDAGAEACGAAAPPLRLRGARARGPAPHPWPGCAASAGTAYPACCDPSVTTDALRALPVWNSSAAWLQRRRAARGARVPRVATATANSWVGQATESGEAPALKLPMSPMRGSL